MAKLIPVDHDPFATSSDDPFTGPPPTEAEAQQDYLSVPDKQLKLVPVDHDPFAKAQSAPAKEKPNYLEDIAKSGASGVAEGLAAATPLGMGLNAVSGGVDLGNYVYKTIAGRQLNNPIPTSSDVLRGFLEKTPIQLHDAETLPGKYANTVAQFAAGGKASGIPLSSSIPSAVVSEASGQLTENTPLEIPARIAGAVLGGAGANSFRDKASSLRNRTPTPTADDIKAQSQQQYALAEQKGGILKPEFTNKFLSEVEKVKPQTEAGKLVAGDSAAAQIADRLSVLKDRPLSLSEAQEIDEFLGDKIDDNFKEGRLTKQGKKLLDMQSSFRNMIDDADTSSVAGGKEGFDALKQGRELWSQQARMRDIEKIISRADMTDNPATSIKTGFRTLANNPSRIRGFNPEERALISKAADSGVVTDILRTFGSRLIPISTVVSGGGLPGAIASQAATMASRGAATKMQVGRAQNVANAVASRNIPSPAPVPNSNLQLLQHINNLSMQPMQGRRLTGTINNGASRSTPFNPKLLPAPARETIVDGNGNVRMQTHGERDAAIAARQRSEQLGLSLDVRAAQQARDWAEKSLSNSSAWQNISKQERETIAKQMDDMWQSQQVPLSDMVGGAIRKAEELARAKGESIEGGAMRDALRTAIERSNLKTKIKRTNR